MRGRYFHFGFPLGMARLSQSVSHMDSREATGRTTIGALRGWGYAAAAEFGVAWQLHASTLLGGIARLGFAAGQPTFRAGSLIDDGDLGQSWLLLGPQIVLAPTTLRPLQFRADVGWAPLDALSRFRAAETRSRYGGSFGVGYEWGSRESATVTFAARCMGSWFHSRHEFDDWNTYYTERRVLSLGLNMILTTWPSGSTS